MGNTQLFIKKSAPDLVVADLHKSYGNTAVLNGLSLHVDHGESVALLGSNGSGKSTFLRTIPGLHSHDSGTIQILGKELANCKGKELRKVRSQIGFVFQKHNLVPRISALSNVIHGLQGSSSNPRYWLQSLAPQQARQKAMYCLDLVGLGDLASRRADRLSGGQSQRVAIARALMQEPAIILADEPVASLDPVAGTEVMELLYQLAREHSITLLFTSHHIEHALQYSNRIVGLRNGQIEMDATTQNISPEELRCFYDQSSNNSSVRLARAV